MKTRMSIEGETFGQNPRKDRDALRELSRENERRGGSAIPTERGTPLAPDGGPAIPARRVRVPHKP